MMLKHRSLLLSSLLPLVFGGFCDAPGWSLSFQDEFSGSSLNETNWNILNGTVDNDSSCRDAMCLTDNVSVENGALLLTAKRQNAGWAQYTTGAVNSQNKRFFQATVDQPFRLCVSGKVPGGNGVGAGLWPAFWMMPNDNSCWPDHGEQDIFEMVCNELHVSVSTECATLMDACQRNVLPSWTPCLRLSMS